MKNQNIHRSRGAISLGEFLETMYPADKPLLGKMILEKSIGLISGPRGGGKSWNAMLFAYAIAAEKPLEPWGTGSGVPVVILDGEMRAAGVQERFQLIHAKNKCEQSRAKAEANIQIISRDHIGDPIGSIDTEEGQASIDALIPESAKLVIVDNLSAWTSGGREDGTSWATIKNWLIKKRLRRVAVLLIHHTGKNGAQRGTSMHEDLLDYSILLSHLDCSAERQGTRFGIEHTKLRDYIPELQRKYEGAIWTKDGSLMFEFVPAGFSASQNEIEMLRLREEGMSMEEIGRVFGVDKSTISRALKKVRVQSADDGEGMDA